MKYFIYIIFLCSCSNSVKLFEHLPENCSDCEIEFKKFNDVECVKNITQPIIDKNEFIRRLKELNFYHLENPEIGNTNDLSLSISKKDTTLLAIEIWIENEHAYVFENGKYYYSLCESLEYLFKK